MVIQESDPQKVIIQGAVVLTRDGGPRNIASSIWVQVANLHAVARLMDW